MRQNNTTDKIIDYNNENCNIFAKYDCNNQHIKQHSAISSPKKLEDALKNRKKESKNISDLEDSELMYYFSDITSNHLTYSDISKNSILSLKADNLKLLSQIDYASHKIKKKKIVKEKPQKNKRILTPMEFYQYSLCRPSKKSCESLCNVLREHYKKKKLMINHNSQALVLSKCLQITWLPTTYLNPITECRFMDYILPLDSKMFEADFTEPMDWILKLDRIKRITEIQTDKVNNVLRLVLEDRDPIHSKEISPCRVFTLEYYKDWLLSLNNQKAKDFKDCLEKFQKQ